MYSFVLFLPRKEYLATHLDTTSNIIVVILCSIFVEMGTSVSDVLNELQRVRKASGLTHQLLAQRAGVSRMTVQRTEAGKIDPRLSTLLVLARALGMDLMLVPKALRPELENFVQSGGRFLGQPPGVGAPPSLIDELLRSEEPSTKYRATKNKP
jgi:transcriptional regulator with XRE-family HTH domain